MSGQPPRIFDPADEDAAVYRGLSSLAVMGLLAGLFAPLAMFGTTFYLIPVAATVLSAVALRRIAAQAPNLVGRKAALGGLLLGVAFLVAAPADELLYRRYIRREAREVAAEWFDAVRRHDVLAANNMVIEPKYRVPPDVPLAEYYNRTDYQKRMLTLFIDQPLIRTLFALGDSAEYRYYETEEEGGQDGTDFVESIYAVTFPGEDQQKETFFISVPMTRKIESTGRCNWTIGRVEGPERPPGW